MKCQVLYHFLVLGNRSAAAKRKGAAAQDHCKDLTQNMAQSPKYERFRGESARLEDIL